MKKLILIVIDGLTPSMFESAVGDDRVPALTFLAEQGRYSRAVSTFPSLTPVCLSSIATGAHPDVHRIPHLVWYDRERARVVEYGSSFAALRAAGMARSILDTVINMNRVHLGDDAVTLYESLEDAGLTTAAINITCYRGRTRHLPTLPGLTIPAYGPKRFFFYNLFESDPTGARLAVFGRAQGIDRRLRGGGRAVARHARRLRLPRLLPPGLRLRLARARAGRDLRSARAQRRGDRRAARRRRRTGRVPRALRSRVLLRPRADARDRADAARDAVRRRRARARDRVEPCRDAVPPPGVRGRRERPRSPARRRPRGGSHPLPGGRRGDRASRRRRSFASRSATGSGTRAGTRASSTTPTASSVPGRALRNPNAGDLLVSAAPGLRVRRPRRPASRRRREPRVADPRRLGGADARRSASRRSRTRSSTSHRRCSTTSASRRLPYARSLTHAA